MKKIRLLKTILLSGALTLLCPAGVFAEESLREPALSVSLSGETELSLSGEEPAGEASPAPSSQEECEADEAMAGPFSSEKEDSSSGQELTVIESGEEEALQSLFTDGSDAAFSGEASLDAATSSGAGTAIAELSTFSSLISQVNGFSGPVDVLLYRDQNTGTETGLSQKDAAAASRAALSLREALRRRETRPSLTVPLEGKPKGEVLMQLILTEALSESGRSDEGEYLFYHIVSAGGSCIPISGGAVLTYEVRYYTSLEEEEAVSEAVSSILSDLQLTGLSDLKKAEKIYGWLASEVECVPGSGKYSAFNALVERKSVCQGFSLAAVRLMKEAGLDVHLLTGTAFGELHMWVLLGLDGLYYNCDPTWDAQEGEPFHWFLKSDATFSQSHMRDNRCGSPEYALIYPTSLSDY